MSPSVLVPVVESSQVALVRRMALGLGTQVGLDSAAVGNLGLAVTEAATNLVKHATNGFFLLRELVREEAGEVRARGVEVLCIDRGPGIANVGACMRDGFSTAGSPGTGLGAMRRLASGFDLHSLVGTGTTLLLEFWSRDAARADPAARVAVGSVSVAHAREEVCGDGWSTAREGHLTALLVVDGIGHGQAAADAARIAIESFRSDPTRAVVDQIAVLGDALRGSRGAAAAVTLIDHERRTVDHCGVGNTSSTLLHADGIERMVSQPGTLGHNARHVRAFRYAWTPTTTAVLTTDGISTRWNLDAYPEHVRCHPSLVAGMLYRDWQRGEDDATVLVARGIA